MHTRWERRATSRTPRGDRRGGRWLVLAAVLAASVLIAIGTNVPQAASAPPRITFGLEPASALGPDGRPDLAYSVTPGAVVYDHVAALNYSAQPLSVQLFATDAVETSGGGFGLLPNQATPTGVGTWVSIPPQDATVQVPPASAHGPGTVVVPITVRVPLHATPGDHSGGVLVSLASAARTKNQENVVLEQRVGTRLLMVVAGPLMPKLALSDIHTTYTGTPNPVGRGKVHLSFVISNLGNVNLASRLSADVSGLFGSSVHVSLRHVPLLLPGASVRGAAVVSGVWPQFLVHTTLTAQPQEVTSSQSAALPTVTATTAAWAMPWILVLIVLVLLISAFWFARRRRKKSTKLPSRESNIKQRQKKLPAEVGT